MSKDKDGSVRARTLPKGGYHARYKYMGHWRVVYKAGKPAIFADPAEAREAAHKAYSAACNGLEVR